jgi:hypothetical protein
MGRQIGAVPGRGESLVNHGKLGDSESLATKRHGAAEPPFRQAQGPEQSRRAIKDKPQNLLSQRGTKIHKKEIWS